MFFTAEFIFYMDTSSLLTNKTSEGTILYYKEFFQYIIRIYTTISILNTATTTTAATGEEEENDGEDENDDDEKKEGEDEQSKPDQNHKYHVS